MLPLREGRPGDKMSPVQ